MAWTTISNALVAVGALPFATTIQALRDNPIAIANGDAGAPQIQTAALIASERITTANIAAAYAGAAVGGVGAYATAQLVSGSVGFGGSVSGGSLALCLVNVGATATGALSGTWINTGASVTGSGSVNVNSVAIWRRIA